MSRENAACRSALVAGERGRSGRQARADLDHELAEVREALGQVGANVGRLGVRLEAHEKRARELDERIATYERVGQDTLAATLKSERALLEEERQSDAQERETAKRLHDELLRRAQALHQAFRERVQRVERRIDEVEAREAQATAAARLDADLTPPSRGESALADLESQLDERHAHASGQVEVAAPAPEPRPPDSRVKS